MAVVCGVVLNLIESLGDPDQPEPIVMSLADYGPDTISLVQDDTLGLDELGFNDQLKQLIGETE